MDYVNEARRGFISLDKLFVWGSDARASLPLRVSKLFSTDPRPAE